MKAIGSVVILVMWLAVGTPVFACTISPRTASVNAGDSIFYGDLQINILAREGGFGCTVETYMLADIKAPNYKGSRVRLDNDKPIIKQICGREVAITFSSFGKASNLKVAIW